MIHYLKVLSPIISGCLLSADLSPHILIRYLIAHYIGLSTLHQELEICRIKFLSPIISGCLHNQEDEKLKCPEAYRPLYRAVYDLSPHMLIRFFSYRPLYRAVYVSKEIAKLKDYILIAHYIGLSTRSRLYIRRNIYLSPIISGCLPKPYYCKTLKNKNLSPIISGCLHNLSTLKTGLDFSYRPLYRAVYAKAVNKDNDFRVLSPIISGCLHTKMTEINHYENNLIAHYIGLSTTIFSVAFH